MEPDVSKAADRRWRVPDSQTFLVGQQVEAVFVRSNLVTADGFYGRPTTINQPQYPEPGEGGRVISTETAFGSSHIKDSESWHQTKRRRKAWRVRLWSDPSCSPFQSRPLQRLKLMPLTSGDDRKNLLVTLSALLLGSRPSSPKTIHVVLNWFSKYSPSSQLQHPHY